jgi:hypothetical protein
VCPFFRESAFFADLLSVDFSIPGATNLQKYDETDRWDYRRVSWVWHLDKRWHGLRITASQDGHEGYPPSATIVTVQEGSLDGGDSPEEKIHFHEECKAEKVGELVTRLAQQFAL